MKAMSKITTVPTSIDGMAGALGTVQHLIVLSSRIQQLEQSNKTMLIQNKLLLDKMSEISMLNNEALQAIRNFQIDFSPRKRKNRDEFRQYIKIMYAERML